MPASDYVLWQLIDSALPTGALAHSGGLEVRGLARPLPDLKASIKALLCQAIAQQIPLVTESFDNPDALRIIDQRADALLTNHVARRASIAQGRAILSVMEKVKPGLDLQQYRQEIRDKQFHGHIAPLYGFVFRAMGVTSEQVRASFVFVLLRDMISAAIRLGYCGPIEAQRIQLALLEEVDQLLELYVQEQPVQVNPVQDIIQGMHDRLYSRLFTS